MTPLTEASVRGMLSLDPRIPKERIELAMHILSPEANPMPPKAAVIPIPEACRMLNLSKRSLPRYYAKGLLVRVYPPGSRYAAGITRDSIERLLRHPLRA